MDSNREEKYKKISIKDDTNVSATRVEVPQHPSWKILLMGPTGAGKSSFVEALGLNGSEKISSNGLEGFTQTLTTYMVTGITSGQQSICMLDSPGFADTRISEMAIVSMIKEWIVQNGEYYFNYVLYLTPITRIRLPGSQRQVLKTFQALTGMDAAKNVIIVTTMWDTLWTETSKARAEQTYRQLQNDIWKNYIQLGAQIVKFYNTRESVLNILDQAFGSDTYSYFSFEKMIKNSQAIQQTPFAADMYSNLIERIQNLELAQTTTRQDLKQAEVQADNRLAPVLQSQLREIEADLDRFQKELIDFGPPPTNPSDITAPHPDIPSAVNPTHSSSMIDSHSLITPNNFLPGPHEPNHLPNPVAPVPISHPTHAPEIKSDTTSLDSSIGWLSRALESLNCCGKAVSERHVE